MNINKTKYNMYIKNILLIINIVVIDNVFFRNSMIYIADIRHVAEILGLLHKVIYYAGVIYLANSRWFYLRLITGIFIAVFIYIDEVFKTITGGIMSVPDLDMMLMASVLWKEALVFYAPYIFDFKTIFLVGTFLFLYIWYPKSMEKTSPFVEFFLQMGIITIFITDIFRIPNNTDEYLDMYMPFIRIPGEYVLVVQNPINTKRVALEVFPEKNKMVKNIIFVIDESVRADYVSKNNQNVDIEFQDKYADMITDFGTSYSSINCSYGSRSYIRFASTPEAVLNKAALSNPTIWQYADNAGYKTYLMGYTPLKSNLLSKKEVEKIGYYEHMSLDEYRPYYDAELAKKIKQKIKDNNGYNFFYVSKEGVHFPYEDAYPAKEAFYKPHLGPKESMIDALKTKNSYKNALKWSVDSFFNELFDGDLDMSETVVIYTSDHGEYINSEDSLDNFVPQTHCSVIDPRIDEFQVPLIVFTKNAEVAKKLSKQKGANHFHIVPTVLKLMGYENNQKSLFDEELGSYPSFYGDPFGRFEKTKVFEF